MRILMIDNYDSFTYNLVQYLGELRCDVEVRRNDDVDVDALVGSPPEALVISPGPCSPREAGCSVEAIQKLAGVAPILGVCLGHQAMAFAFDGEVVRAPRIMHGKTSPILHDGRGVFRGLPLPFEATRYHSLIVRRETLPPDFDVSAWTAEDEIMGIRHRRFPLEGVQFHPESILTERGHDLLRNFLDDARAWWRERRGP